MAREILELAAPIGGLRRDAGYQSKPPYYSEAMRNVRAYDVIEGRGRIGSRPGLVKSFQGQLGGGNPIRLASVIRTFNESGTTSFLDEFPGVAMSGNWSAATTGTLPTVQAGIASTPIGTTSRAVLTSLSDVSTTALREASIYVDNNNTGYIKHYFLMLDTVATDDVYIRGILGQVVFSGGLAALTLRVNGAIVATKTVSGMTAASRFSLSIDAANTISMTYRGTSGPDIQYAATGYTPTSDKPGFALYAQPGSDSTAFTQWFGFVYQSTAGGLPPEAAVFSSNHLLYRESSSGALAEVAGSTVDLASDTRIYAAPRLEKLYIADYEVRRQRATKSSAATVANVSSTQAILDDSAVSDWTALGIDVDGDVLEILDATGVSAATTVLLGIYNIASIHATNGITFDRTGAVRIASETAYRIVRYPKVYDASQNTLTRVTLGLLGDGTASSPTSQFPAGCRSFSQWQDRIVACNDPNTPLGYWMSASGYPLIWDYGDTGLVAATGGAVVSPSTLSLGVSAAIAGTQSEFAGLIGEPLVTTIPISDDLLILACRTSFYFLRGNPREGGKMNNISREIGIVGIGAHCQTPDGKLIVLTPDGLYEITLDEAIPLSRDVIPQELIGITDDRYEVSLAYDVLRRGVLISAVARDSTLADAVPPIYYFWDQRTGGFFPQEHDSDHQPTAVTVYQPSGVGTPTVLWGCRDGYVRQFEDAAEDDDGTNFNSDLLYGPIRLGSGDYGEGMLHEIAPTLDNNSGELTLSVHLGNNAQTAKDATARFSTTLVPGRNRNRYPRLRDCTAYLKITGIPGTAWAMEGLTITRESLGRLSVTTVTNSTQPSTFLADLRAITTIPTKKFAWHPLDRANPQPDWLPDLIRLSRSICFDLRVVDGTGENTGYPGAMSWAEILAWQSLYSAQCVLSFPPYAFGGYVNTNPMVTNDGIVSDATHLAQIQGYVNTVVAAGVTVRTVWMDTETFSAASPNNAANAAHNTALNLKFSQVYNIIKTAWPAATVCFYGQGAVVPSATATLTTDPNAMTNPADSPYPWGPGWALHGWNVERYDVTDVTAPYTTGTVTPWIGDAICPAMYYPAEFNTQRLLNQFSHRYYPSKPIVAFFGMGQSQVRTYDNWEGSLAAFDYSTDLSDMYGAMFDNSPFWNTEARSQRYWYEMAEVVLWPGIDSADAINAENHTVAFINGMNR